MTLLVLGVGINDYQVSRRNLDRGRTHLGKFPFFQADEHLYPITCLSPGLAFNHMSNPQGKDAPVSLVRLRMNDVSGRRSDPLYLADEDFGGGQIVCLDPRQRRHTHNRPDQRHPDNRQRQPEGQ